MPRTAARVFYEGVSTNPARGAKHGLTELARCVRESRPRILRFVPFLSLSRPCG